MNIFLPFKKELNPYLDEIIINSEHTYCYDSYLNYDPSFEFVNIHWPEAIFEWKEPSDEQLKELARSIIEWKKKSVLIYTKHDFQRNKGTTTNFTKLFNLIEKYSDVWIHLGEFSQKFYRKKFPLARHEIVYHPLYLNSFKPVDESVAREKLHIDKNAFVVIVPGTIRNYAERDLVLKAFESINIINKVLICINMRVELRYDFPGRIKLKRIVDVKKVMIDRFKNKYRPPMYLFTYGTQHQKEIEVKMSAADLVFVPRIHCLNSGMLFLGLTYKKVVVGPSIGNIAEQLLEFQMPVFNPKNKRSIFKAMKKAVQLSYENPPYYDELLSKYGPKSVAQKIDDLISELI